MFLSVIVGSVTKWNFFFTEGWGILEKLKAHSSGYFVFSCFLARLEGYLLGITWKKKKEKKVGCSPNVMSPWRKHCNSNLEAICEDCERDFWRKIFLVASKRQFGEANVYNHGMGLWRIFITMDCMHCHWKNKSIAWQGLFFWQRETRSNGIGSDHGLESIDMKLSFGLHGKNNDLNIQDISLLISGVLCEVAVGLM